MRSIVTQLKVLAGAKNGDEEQWIVVLHLKADRNLDRSTTFSAGCASVERILTFMSSREDKG
ncbi:MAG TPA: hypothetical protein VGF96_10755 [Terracidiphilus sp.]|jgi:hypothetical protein